MESNLSGDLGLWAPPSHLAFKLPVTGLAGPRSESCAHPRFVRLQGPLGRGLAPGVPDLTRGTRQAPSRLASWPGACALPRAPRISHCHAKARLCH
jgi:hypothetical protein